MILDKLETMVATNEMQSKTTNDPPYVIFHLKCALDAKVRIN